MAEIVQKVRIQVDNKQAKKASKEVEKTMISAMVKSQVAVQAFNKALQFGAKVLKDSIANVLEYERTMIRLRTALDIVGESNERNIELLVQQASVLQDITAISDETIRETQTLALSYGVSVENIDKYVKASIEMSNVTGRDVKGSLEQLIKTQQGLIDRTLKVIPGISDLTVEQLKQGAAIDLVNEKWGKFIGVRAEGTVGALEQMKRAFEDLTEQIGLASKNTDFFDHALLLVTSRMTVLKILIEKQGFFKGLALLPTISASQGLDLIEMYKELGKDSAKALAEGLATNFAKWTQGTDLGDAFGGKEGEKKRKAAQARRKKLAADAASQAKRAKEFEDRLVFGATIRFMEIDLQMDADLKKAKEEDEKLHQEKLLEIKQQSLEKQREQQEKNAAMITGFASLSINAINSLFEDLVTGSDDAAQKFASNMLRGIGRSLLGKGNADMAAAIASGLIYGNWSGIGAAGAEIALGSALSVGGAVIAPSSSTGSGRGAGGGAGAAQNTSTFAAGAGGTRTGSGGGDKTVVINLNGPILSSAAAGIQIRDALSAAERQGLG